MSKYPFLQEESAKLPFNIWLCCDYKDKNRFTFVEKLIQEDPLIPYKKTRNIKIILLVIGFIILVAAITTVIYKMGIIK